MSVSADVLVIGGGPAGLTAGLYAARAGARVIVAERTLFGGQASLTDRIENYPGFPEGIGGAELGIRMHQQAQVHGAEFVTGEVSQLEVVDGGGFAAQGGVSISARAVVLATGSSPRRLGVPGEDGLIGRGVSFCATCDGPLYRNRRVAVIGGGDAAVEEALFLARFAERVTIVHRRGELRAVKALADRVQAEPRIEVLWHHVVVTVNGDQTVSGVTVEDVRSGERKELAADGLFVYIGALPNTGLLPRGVEFDGRGYVVTGDELQTSIGGLFAAGDVRATPLRQVATAVGDGAIAGAAAERYAHETARRGE